jgi:hypothetical protein
MALPLPRPSYAAVTASLALAVALGAGGAVAADKIQTQDIAKNAVRSKQIKNGTIKLKDLSDAAKPLPPGPPGLRLDYDTTLTGIDLGNPVPAGQCLGSDTPALTPRAGTDGTIADDQVLVTVLNPTFIGTLASGRPEGTDRVRYTVCNFTPAPRNFNGLSLRISTIDPS